MSTLLSQQCVGPARLVLCCHSPLLWQDVTLAVPAVLCWGWMTCLVLGLVLRQPCIQQQHAAPGVRCPSPDAGNAQACAKCHSLPYKIAAPKQVDIACCTKLQPQAGSFCLQHALAAPQQSPFAAWQDSEKTQFDDEAERRRELHRERADEQAERLRDAYNQLKYTAQDKVRLLQPVRNRAAQSGHL